MNIVGGIDGGGGGSLGSCDRGVVDRLPVEDSFHRGQPQRPVGNPDDADMSVAGMAIFILVVKQRGGGHGKIAAAAGEFLESPAPARRPGWQADFQR